MIEVDRVVYRLMIVALSMLTRQKGRYPLVNPLLDDSDCLERRISRSKVNTPFVKIASCFSLLISDVIRLIFIYP